MEVVVVVILENQMYVDYEIVFRTLEEGAGSYREELDKMKRLHAENRDLQGGAFLSGIGPADKPAAVFPIVFTLNASRGTLPHAS